MRLIRFLDFELNLALFEIHRNGCPIELGSRAIDALVYLIDRRDRIVSKEELRQEVWQSAALSAATIPTTIMEIRRALGDSASDPSIIGSVRARGYRFLPTVDTDDTRFGDQPELARQLTFAGRQPQLATLLDIASDVRRRKSGRTVAIHGEAGIGKTRLLSEFLGRVGKDFESVVSRCSLIDGAPPFWPWTQALQSAFAIEGVESEFIRTARKLASVHPEILGSVQPEREELGPVDRFSLFNHWISAFRTLSSSTPIVLAFEDVHLADLDSLDLLACLSEEIEGAPILLIATHRPPTFTDRRADRLSEIRSLDSSFSMRVDPLSKEDVVEILGPRDENNLELGRSLHDRSQGIPFYITRLLRDIETERSIDKSLSGREIVSRQLSDLPENVRSTLAVAALIGDRFSAPLLAEVVGRSVQEVAEELTLATRSWLLTQNLSDYEFSHSLLRESLSSSLDPSLKRRFHLSIATELQRLPHAHSRTAQIADHLSRAAPLGDASAASRFARLAGLEAESRFAYSIASKYLSRALDLSPADGSIQARCELMRDLARATLYAGDRILSRATLIESANLARASGLPESLALAALQLAPDFLSIEVGVNDATHIGLLEEALRDLDEEMAALRARVIAHLSQAIQWTRDPDRVERLAASSLDLAIESGDRDALIAALSARAESLHGPARAPERLKYVESLGEIANVASDHPTTLLKHTRAITAHLELGNIPEVERENERYRTISSQLDLPQYRWYPLAHDSTLAMLRGEIRTAEGLAENFRALAGASPDQNCLQTYAAHLALRCVEEDRLDQALGMIEAFAEEQAWMYHWRIAVPWFYIHCGALEKAHSYSCRFSEHDLRLMGSEPGGGQALAMCAEVFAALENKGMCEKLFEMLEPLRDRCATIGYGVGYFGSLARYAGLVAHTLGMSEIAAGLFMHASSQERERGAPSWYAYAEADLARCMVESGESGSICKPRLDEAARVLRDYELPRATRLVREAQSLVAK